MCIICGENNGYLDNGERCWGCDFDICPKCGRAKMPYKDVKCPCEKPKEGEYGEKRP